MRHSHATHPVRIPVTQPPRPGAAPPMAKESLPPPMECGQKAATRALGESGHFRAFQKSLPCRTTPERTKRYEANPAKATWDQQLATKSGRGPTLQRPKTETNPICRRRPESWACKSIQASAPSVGNRKHERTERTQFICVHLRLSAVPSASATENRSEPNLIAVPCATATACRDETNPSQARAKGCPPPRQPTDQRLSDKRRNKPNLHETQTNPISMNPLPINDFRSIQCG